MNDNANVSIDATTKNRIYFEIGGMFFQVARIADIPYSGIPWRNGYDWI